MSMDSIAGVPNAETMVSAFLLLLSLAFLVELLTAIFKQFIPNSVTERIDFPFPLVIACVWGVIIAVTARVDALRGFGLVVHNKTIGYIITGLISSSGSQGVHELIAKWRSSRPDILTKLYDE